jgi:CubicO group peptidase (beta-lactamase class C family)
MRFIFTLALLFISQLSLGQQDLETFEAWDTEINRLVSEYQAAGLSVAVVKNNEVIYAKGFGHRDLANQLPVTENTVFHIASMTKAFTGALLGVLESKNLLSLQDKPAYHIPNFHFQNEKMDQLVTLGDLLSHRSGLGNHGASIVMFPEKDKLKTVQRLQYLKPQGEIKNSWIYSNMGYTLAGTVAEQVSHKSWEDNVRSELFEPLDMWHSFTNVKDMKTTQNYAKGYAMHKGKTLQVPFENYYAYTPAGGIKSSVKDLSHWMQAWLNKGVYQNKQVIPETYVKAATRLQNLKNDAYEKDSYLWGEGYGWRLRAWESKYRVRHGGNTLGFSTIMDLYPFEGVGVVVLTNQSNSLLPYAVSDYISRKLLQLPELDFPIQVNDIYQSKTEDLKLNKEKMPLGPVTAFEGRYSAEGYGAIKIFTKQEKLFAKFPTYTFQLAHSNYNFFYLKGTESFSGEFNPQFDLEFNTNWKGEVTGLKFHAHQEPIVFTKQ